MARKKNNGTPEETPDNSPVDPMATVIEEMPQPSEFADNITAPGDNSETDSEDDSEPGFSFDESPTSTTASVTETPEVFDPAIHCTNPDGTPKLTKSGKFRRKRGKANAQPTPDLNAPDPLRMQNATVAAQVATQATFIAGQIAFGPEGQPIDNEAEMMQQAYTNMFYMSEKPVTIQPWVLVAMVSCAYISKRMAMEEPRNRVLRGWDWLSTKAVNLWGMIWGN